MPFERFEKRARPITRDATITLQRSGAISFNRAAWEAMGSPDVVELLFDPDTRRVGIQTTDESAQHAYALHGGAKRERNSFIISGKAFTQYYDIDLSRSIRRIATLENGMLIVSLDDPGIEVTSNRGRKKNAAAAAPGAAASRPLREVSLSQRPEGVQMSRGTG